MLQVTIGVLALSAIVFVFGFISARNGARLRIEAKRKAEDQQRRTAAQSQKRSVDDATRPNQANDKSPIFDALRGGEQKTVSR
jgi:hypothetical protein